MVRLTILPVSYDRSMASPFTIRTISFLRALKRNNDREWFRARKEQYEADVRQPMIELLARLDRDFRSFAPEFVSEPKVSLYRIYRDTRFSADKSPLKTHVAAHFPMRGLPKGEGGGLYLEIAPRVGMDGWRALHAIESATAGDPGAHRRYASTLAPPGHGSSVSPARRRASRGASVEGAARLRQGSSRGALSALQAVPRGTRIRGGIRHRCGVLP